MDWLGYWDIVDAHPNHRFGGDPMTERKEATVSQIKQYGARGPLSDPPILGEYIMVTYADHLAALRACEQRVLDAAREAIEVLLKEWWEKPDDLKELKSMVELNRAIIAIDALKEKR